MLFVVAAETKQTTTFRASVGQHGGRAFRHGDTQVVAQQSAKGAGHVNELLCADWLLGHRSYAML